MKHVIMTRRRKPKVPPPLPASPRPRKGGVDDAQRAAFDVWLQRGLHDLFDDVAKEPIPEELLRLIEDDRRK
jgi:hypothetical protein